MPHRRADVVATALDVLDRHGLGDLSMRRLAAELDVGPSALYHHVASKQDLLAAVSDEILLRGEVASMATSEAETPRAYANRLRHAMLAVRDGAEVVATVHALGLGVVDPETRLAELMSTGDAGLDAVAAATMLRFVLGHVQDEQWHLQAASAGAIDADPLTRPDRFALGLSIILAGVAAVRDVSPETVGNAPG